MDESCEKGKLRESDESSANLASLSVIIRIVLIILLRGGFLLVQVGNIAVSNVNLIILHNIVEISWVTICCIIIGSTVGFTGGGGYWRWIVGDDDDYDKTARERVLAVWQSVIVASGIFTNCIAGRMHTVGTLAIGIIFGGLLQPLIIHWGWSINGWMINNPLREANNSSGFIDTGGGALIHATGGVVGLVACLILGRKVDATTSGVDANVASTFVGYFFILIGLQSLTISNLSEVYFTTRDVEIDLTIINNLLSISMCAMVTVGLHFFLRQPFNQMTVMRCIQGMIAGAVVVSAGGSIYPPYVALTLGAINGILFYFTIKFIAQCSFVEDYCNTIAIHLVSGLFGALVVPFFNKADDEFNILNSLLDFSWQIICLLSIIGPIILIMTAVFMSLGCCGLLRNRSEHLSHLRVAAALMATQNSHSR
ncbi:putative ammonium transporter 1 [Diachasma alloeum]|uniref:putative ammonium transporter 1 n=1 Tax=Diachasma alloeum TaxID=454923 RepID=UPI0007381F03|nr:putative ammonium transporter 1 [Diachasma alloeum]